MGAVASVVGVVPSKSFNIERTDDSLGPHSSSSSSTTTVRPFVPSEDGGGRPEIIFSQPCTALLLNWGQSPDME